MTKLVAILNVTPDSFSETENRVDHRTAVKHALAMIEEGADVVDIGAESTRPNATSLDPEEEWARLGPCLSPILAAARERGVAISVDTRNAATARLALAAGVDWINDVTGFADPEMRAVVADSDGRLVLMHSLKVPVDPTVLLPEGADVLTTLMEFFAARLDLMERAGIARDRVILDPGLGFGKTAAQSLWLALHPDAFTALARPILIGHSRKSFLKLFTSRPAAERGDVTLAISAALLSRRVDYIRIHEVARHRALIDTIRREAPSYSTDCHKALSCPTTSSSRASTH
ncbi:dihydropteroate synthase [Acuticoccus mangrovi]|uniref:dihydropteroate synthase n=1 Tax=Acuticoccus mangrovi TaxID=2796142 RepID=A0A934IQP0_9HYPH|nr:dihydropteroate synthase [Acuticoccus mangrovi]MBJ3776527.1 dihydropteroate synthase [Acuticoccus mangrovi]